VAGQKVRWDEGGSQPADNYTFFYGNGNAHHHGQKKKWREAGEECIMTSFINYVLHIIILGWSNQDVVGGACNMHGRNDKCI